MIKKVIPLLALLAYTAADACTNFIVTRGASLNGNIMVTYAADSHQLYGVLYHHAATRKLLNPKLKIYNWDEGTYMGEIDEAPVTYSTVGNMNEHSLIITETTWGGKEELVDTMGIMDYGSLIYVTLQRAKTAREAIQTIVELASRYGYPSEGESFSIADKDEAWIMELCGKGVRKGANGENLDRGIVWVARRIPDGYVSAHANQARITTFPKNDPENCLYSKDVISFAREKGYYNGSDEDFSFSDVYNPLDFGGMRGCEARVWSFFRSITPGMDQYLDYAMGHNPLNRMPLWVKPEKKISQKQLFDAMRDHYEGTALDMTTDIGAGGNHLPYRWRPMTFKVDGVAYTNERATATQQTGFWLCGEARKDKTGILWFGVDDTATSCLTPIYCNCTEVPWSLSEENGSMLKYSQTSMFWLFNRISNFAYSRYDVIAKRVRQEVDAWENARIAEVEKIDLQAAQLNTQKAQKFLTRYSVETAQKMFSTFSSFEQYLWVKYIDGNIKGEDEKGFKDNGAGKDIPGEIIQPGYSEKWKKAVVNDHGETLKVH